MEVLLAVIKNLHFLLIYFLLISITIWVREEFKSVFRRKEAIKTRSLKLLLTKILVEQSGRYSADNKKSVLRTFEFFLLLIALPVPLAFIPLSDRFDFMGSEISLGIINGTNTLLIYIVLMIFCEWLRDVYNKSFGRSAFKIVILLSMLVTFLDFSFSHSFEQIVQYQKSFNEFGFRNYFLFKNPLGFILLSFAIADELKSVNDEYSLIDHGFLLNYLVLFLYCFIGGYGLPSILEKQNIEPGLNTVLLQNISLVSKYLFTIIILWVLRYSLIRARRYSRGLY